jgi:N-acetylneuraminate synthase
MSGRADERAKGGTGFSHIVGIDGRKIASVEPPYIIAEMSGNHRGSLERALELLEAAKDSGADAVKIQTYTPDTITIDHDGSGFTIQEGLWKGRSLYELYQEAHTPWDWQERIFVRGKELGLAVFSSVFDETSVNFLEGLSAPAYKIASFEIVDLPLIRHCARTAKPLILSTGMADLGEIQEAVNAAREAGCKELLLLHCVSGYPAPAEEYNLRTIAHLAEAFAVPVGLSDHTLGIAVPVAAVALGACAVEKHFTLSRNEGGPDAVFSLEPEELKSMVDACRTAYESLGKVHFGHTDAEAGSLQFRRSLYVVEDVKKGEAFTSKNVRSIRPGFGLAPKHLEKVLKSHAGCDLTYGTPLSWEYIVK